MTEWMWQTDETRDEERYEISARATIGDVIKHALYREQANWFLWLPVGVALGCAAYFSLLTEPSWVFVLGVVFISIILVIINKKHDLAFIFSIFTLAMTTGFLLSKTSSEIVAAPVIQKRIGPVIMKGRIENLLYLASGEAKIIVKPFAIDRLKPENLPRRVRLKLRKSQNKTDLFPGQFIEAKIILFPPPEPTHPGGFDFARKNWFEGIGGSGFFLTAPQVLTLKLATPLYARISASLARLRIDISNRLKARLGNEKGGLAAALIVGDRAAISKSMVDRLRNAGLAHLLAISGLHMVLFAGTIFWLLRALLAINATLALRWPIKKWAAGVALLGAAFYLAISGATIATQRAFIMITIMFLAIMLDRPALTLRNIAIAALIILVIKPFSLLSVSFQMSFAATTILVAFYEGYSRLEILRSYPASAPMLQGIYKVLIYMSGIAVTTLIAGLATSPFVAYYFQRIAVFSLVANVLALPIIGFIVMPAGLIALLLMPLGLEGPVLAFMGWGLEMVIAIANWTSSLPNAVLITPAYSGFALVLMVIGGLWFCLWQTRWRFWGLGVIIAGVVLAPISSRPDIYITASARNIAVRGKDSLLVVARGNREKYSVLKWLIRDGDMNSPRQAARRPGFTCDSHGCIFKFKDNRLLSFAEDLVAVEEDCARVDILISQVPVRQKCERPVVTIDKFDLWRNGAYTLNFSDKTIVVRNVRKARGDRPWVRKRISRKWYETKK